MKLRTTLVLVWAALCCVGIYAAPDADSKFIIKQLRTTGMHVPYVGETNFTDTPESIFNSVYFCLWRRSAEILAYDKADGVLTWCDTAGSFVSLPTDASFDTMQQINDVAAPRGGGYTYGAALITKLGDQNGQLSIFTLGRSPDIAEETYSDGTYERELINEVGRHLYRISIGQATAIGPAPPSRSNTTNPATNYASAFRGGFRNVSDCPADLIRTNIQGLPYSVPVGRLWTGLLQVLVQYDVVIDLKPEQHKIVFARRVAVPDPVHTNTTTRADALMVAFVEPQSTNSCLYHLGVLDQRTLAPTAVIGQSAGGKDFKIPLLKDVPNFMKAASVVAAQLDRQLDCQMFYTERWGDKFLRRNNETSLHP